MISGTVPPHITRLNDIGDINVPAPIDGYFVYWNAAVGKWQCQADANCAKPVRVCSISGR
ncbi:unnamed protein product, partial [marine sediment metagenome]